MANRAIHLGAHILAIVVLGGAYELRHASEPFVYWRVGSGLVVVFRIGWVAWPYIAAAITTRRYVSAHRLGLIGYILTMAGCVSASVAAVFALPAFQGFEVLELPLTVVQMIVLTNASERFLERYAP